MVPSKPSTPPLATIHLTTMPAHSVAGAESEAESKADSRPTRPFRADRILIIRLGALGDVVRTLPSARALRERFPGAHLAWLVEPGAAEAVEAAGFIDETIVFPREDLVSFLKVADGLSVMRRLGEFIRRLRDRRFDLALDFHGILKSGLLSRLSGAPERLGFDRSGAREFSEVFSNRHVALTSGPVSRYDRNAALTSAVAPDAELPVEPFLGPSALAIARLTARLRVTERDRASGFVLIHPGTSSGASHKRYAPSAWSDVARILASHGANVWIVAGADRRERVLVEEILRLSGEALVRAPETRGFDDLLALFDRAAVFVSSDSGPLHAASLAGVPVVQLLGPTHPIENAPWRHSPALRAHIPLACSPCRRGCADPACMRVIPPSLVASLVEDLLGSSGHRSEDAVAQSQ